MSLFGFGGGKQSSSSQSSSWDYGQQESYSFSDSLANAASQSTQGSSQTVANQAILDIIYGQGAEAYGRAAGAVPLLQGQSAQLFNSGGQFLESLQGGAGSEYLAGRVSGESPVLQEQIDALGSDIGRFFQNEINPAITSEAVAGGALGGGRQGVAQGRAADAAAREFQVGAMNLRSADVAARDAAAAQLGQQGIAAAGTGLNALPGMYGMAESAALAEMAPAQILSQIIGGPTVLTESFGQSTSESESIARAISEMMGYNYGGSQSTSTSKGKSFNFGV